MHNNGTWKDSNVSKHNEHSSYREKLIEHLFIGELLKLSWQKYDCGLEVAKPEVDNSGYDVLAECFGIVRHIQLKASHIASSTASQKVHVKLADKPSGCMVWIIFDEDLLTFKHFLFYGDSAGEPFPSIDTLKVAKHTKGNKDGIKAERPSIRVIKKGQFKVIPTMDELYNLLFCVADTQVSPSFENESSQVTTNNSDFVKLHRIEKWSKDTGQKNSQLIRTYLALEKSNTAITLNNLIDDCIRNYGGAKSEWKNNFNSMKSDLGNSHGKIFYQSEENVHIYETARLELRKFFN